MPSKKSKLLAKSAFLKQEKQSYTEDELRSLARELACELQDGDRVFLEGPLGVGKSTFAREVLIGLGVDATPEGSPTYPIVHQYQNKNGLSVNHIDFYRLENERAIEEAGIEEIFWTPDGIVLMEWASQFPEFKKKCLESWIGRVVEISFAFLKHSNQRTINLDQSE